MSLWQYTYNYVSVMYSVCVIVYDMRYYCITYCYNLCFFVSSYVYDL